MKVFTPIPGCFGPSPRKEAHLQKEQFCILSFSFWFSGKRNIIINKYLLLNLAKIFSIHSQQCMFKSGVHLKQESI